MAEEKKPSAGGKPSGGKPATPAPKKSDPFAEIFGLLMTVVIAMYLLNGFVAMLAGNGFVSDAWTSVFPNANSTAPRPFSREGILQRHTMPVAGLQNPINAKVLALGDTAVFYSPGDSQIGTQSANARGKIIQGPVWVSGENYYFVQFPTGKSGWVAESDIGAVTSEPTAFENFLLWIYSLLSFFKFLSVLFCLCLAGWIAYIIFHLTEIRKKQRALLYPQAVASDAENTVEVNPKWRKVLAHVDSTNESDWKLAVIECDIMLDDILDKLHLPGDTMGEKMKAVEKSDFTTIDNAWEAHKIRNQVAHEGSEYILTQHEARRVVALYQTVFEEFQIL